MIAVKGYCVIVVEDGAAEELVKKWQQQLAENPQARQPVGGSMDECMGKLPTLLPRAGSERGDDAPAGQVDEGGQWGPGDAGFDIGQYLKEHAIEYFKARGKHVTVRLSTPGMCPATTRLVQVLCLCACGHICNGTYCYTYETPTRHMRSGCARAVSDVLDAVLAQIVRSCWHRIHPEPMLCAPGVLPLRSTFWGRSCLWRTDAPQFQNGTSDRCPH